ncbi:MAG: porin family protein [Bacteroidales bacterium]|nr:porin family protein [Bacteroidales bacterium]
MKKTILLLLSMVALMAAQAQQHVEFKWHRMYGVAGYSFTTNISSLQYQYDGGQFDDKAAMQGVYAVGGWQIRKESGIGLGVEFMKDFASGYTMLPVFVEVRSHYLRNQISPFTSVYVGYSIPLGFSGMGTDYVKIETGGPAWGLNVGARYAINRKMGVNAFIGYQGIFLNRVNVYHEGELQDAPPVLMQNFKVGVGFNF